LTDKVAKIAIDNQGRSFEARVVEAFEGQTVKKIAEIVGLNYHTFRNYLQQRTDVPPDLLVRIAKTASTTTDWLLTGEESGSDLIELPLSEEEWEAIARVADSAGKRRDEMMAQLLRERLAEIGALPPPDEITVPVYQMIEELPDEKLKPLLKALYREIEESRAKAS
jgi:hypothetical protein